MPKKKTEGKPLTLSQLGSELIKFFNKIVEPQFMKLEQEMKGFRQEANDRFREFDCRFDDLYKKFEDLHHEYIISNEQIKRLAGGFVTKEDYQVALSDLKAKVSMLQEKIEELERRALSH